MAEGSAHKIVITFERSDSTNYSLDVEAITPEQFFVASNICLLMGNEFWQRKRMQEMAAAAEAEQSRIVKVAGSFDVKRNES